MRFISVLIIAWVLALFGFDKIVAQALHELFGVEVSRAVYYFIAFIIGVLFDLAEVIRGRKNRW